MSIVWLRACIGECPACAMCGGSLIGPTSRSGVLSRQRFEAAKPQGCLVDLRVAAASASIALLKFKVKRILQMGARTYLRLSLLCSPRRCRHHAVGGLAGAVEVLAPRQSALFSALRPSCRTRIRIKFAVSSTYGTRRRACACCVIIRSRYRRC